MLMTNQIIKPVILQPSEIRATRFLYAMTFSALAFAMVIAVSNISPAVVDRILAIGFIKWLVELVPAIKVLAQASTSPAKAQLILASQWMLFPAYLILLFPAHGPFLESTKAKWENLIRKRISEGRGRKSVAIMLIVIIVTILIFLGDTGIAPNMPSFIRGNVFMIGNWALLRHSILGLVFVAWYSPIAAAGVYFMFVVSWAWIYYYFSVKKLILNQKNH